MNDAQLGILMTMSGSEQVTAGFNSVAGTAKTTNNVLITNKMALRELAMGMTQIGVAALSVGVLMKQSNDQLVSNIGNYVMLAGGIMSAVGSSVQFISAISKMVDALKKLREAQILQQAFAGPAGWAALGIGVAVAGAATYGIARYESSQNKAAAVNLHTTVNLDGKKVGEAVRTNIILTQQRNNTSGIK